MLPNRPVIASLIVQVQINGELAISFQSTQDARVDLPALLGAMAGRVHSIAHGMADHATSLQFGAGDEFWRLFERACREAGEQPFSGTITEPIQPKEKHDQSETNRRPRLD